MNSLTRIEKAVLCLLLLTVCVNLTNRYRAWRQEWRDGIASLHSEIKLQASREENNRLLLERWPEEYLTNEKTVARTPLELGAHNWILLIDYQGDRVAAVAIRTDDSYSEAPLGAPADKTQLEFEPYWVPSTVP